MDSAQEHRLGSLVAASGGYGWVSSPPLIEIRLDGAIYACWAHPNRGLDKVAWADTTTRQLVRFEDGTEEWVAVDEIHAAP